MAEYIERELLVKYLEEELEAHGNPDMDSEPIAYGSSLGISYALSLARTLQSSDVVEVRRGWWKKHPCSYECSVCNGELYVESYAEDYDPVEDYYLHYCPNCGTKMDGEREEQK